MQISYFNSLRFRIPVLIISATLLLVGVSYYVSAWYLEKETITRAELSLRDRLYFLQSTFDLVVKNQDAEKAQSLFVSMLSEPDLLVLLYADETGKIKVSNRNAARGENVFELYPEVEPSMLERSFNTRVIASRLNRSENYLDGIAPICNTGLKARTKACGFIYYKIDVNYHIVNGKKLLYTEAIIIAVGLVLVGMSLVLVLYFLITKRFHLLANGLRLFSSGSHSSRLVMDGRDEIYQISQAVNHLFNEIETGERELKRQKEVLDAVFNTVVDGVVTINHKGIIYDCNPAVSKLFGYTKEEMIGQNVSMLMPESYAREHDSYLHNFMTTRVSKVIGKGRDVEAQRKDGHVFPIELSVSEMVVDGKSMFAGVVRDVSERKHLQSALVKANELLFQSNLQLKDRAKTDVLTGIANRRHFDSVLEEEFKRAQRHNSELTLLMCDVDYFKKYNDSYGHQVGDDCLHEIGAALKTLFKRSGELPARYGGEEFAVILPGQNHEQVLKQAEHLCHTIFELNREHNASPVAGRVTLSVGLASLSRVEAADVRMLIACADEALYKAKALGRNQVVVYKSTADDEV